MAVRSAPEVIRGYPIFERLLFDTSQLQRRPLSGEEFRLSGSYLGGSTLIGAGYNERGYFLVLFGWIRYRSFRGGKIGQGWESDVLASSVIFIEIILSVIAEGAVRRKFGPGGLQRSSEAGIRLRPRGVVRGTG